MRMRVFLVCLAVLDTPLHDRGVRTQGRCLAASAAMRGLLSCKLLVIQNPSSMEAAVLWTRQWERGRSRDQDLAMQVKI